MQGNWQSIWPLIRLNRLATFGLMLLPESLHQQLRIVTEARGSHSHQLTSCRLQTNHQPSR